MKNQEPVVAASDVPASDVDSPEEPSSTPSTPPSREIVAQLVGHHREFLRFVEHRLGDRAIAEEILQEAFVRSLDRAGEIPESIVGWFYRVLRNAVIDYQRRQGVAHRRLDQFAAELETTRDPAGDELANVVCACVTDLAGMLKPEYADALRRIDIDGIAVKDYAQDVHISPSNAGVRIFRAREALRKQVARACGTCAEHGCLDCTCSSPPAPT